MPGRASVNALRRLLVLTVGGAASLALVPAGAAHAADPAEVVYTGPSTVPTTSRGDDAVPVTLTATVSADPGPATGTVAFTDGPAGELLCSAPVVDGGASCTFDADLPDPADRTYQVYTALTGDFEGADGPDPLLVDYQPTLVASTDAGPTVTATLTDPIAPEPTITATSNSVDADEIEATAAGLPVGVSLVETGPATWVVRGTPTTTGDFDVVVTVSDGVAADEEVSFTIEVAKDAATVTFTGGAPTTVAQGDDVTLTATVADGDGSGTPTGTVVFTDGAETLCAGPITDGTASCAFAADFEGGASRTYQVVSTLQSAQYAGNDGPDALTVDVTPSLTVGGTAPGGTFTVATSDAIASEPTLTADSNVVDDADITADADGLPAGLTLVRPDPAEAAWVVRGTATGEPGAFPVTVTVSDGPGGAGDVEVTFTVTVTTDAATVTFTGGTPTTVAQGESVTVSATVVDADGSGPVAGTVRFTDGAGGALLCGAPVTAGAASCTFPADFGTATGRTYQVVSTLVSTRYTGADGPDPLVLDLTPTLTASGPTGTVDAVASEPIGSGVTVTADSNVRNDADLTATASGLPADLRLTRPDLAVAAWTVVGTVRSDAGSYDVVVTVSDGPGGAADTTVPFTVAVAKDGATLVYDGRRTVKATQTGEDVATVSFTVVAADLDPNPLAVIGRVVITDGVDGEPLCGGTEGLLITDGRVECTFGADLVTASRTYDVVATLVGPRYTGNVETQVIVSTDPVMTIDTDGADPVAVVATDPVGDVLTITADSNVVDGSQIEASAEDLPAGLALGKSVDDDGNAVFTLIGTPTAAGAYVAAVTIDDGPGNAADEVVTFTVDVGRDAATVTYTGPTQAPVRNSGEPVTLTAGVVDDDGSAPVTGTVTFAEGTTTLCTATVANGTASCAFAATFTGKTRTYAVTASLSSPQFAAPATQPTGLLVSDRIAPATPRITAGPRAGSIVVADRLTFRYASEAGATYQCRLDRSWAACPAGGVTYDRPAAGTHDFRVRAIDPAGNVSPVLTRRVVVPVDDRALTSSGPWSKRTTPSAYRGTYAAVVKRGASLSYRLTGARSVSLVLTKAPGYGGVDVFLGNRRIKTINSTAAPSTRFRQLVKVADFGTPTNGTLRIVTRTAAQVVVEGLAVTRATAG